MAKQKIICVVGPTASGKSALAVSLAKKFRGEIISADSRQVYKGLNIGTGKITKREMKGVPHHLLDVISPKKRFTAYDFVTLAGRTCSSILQKTGIPIIVGGTGFYIDALVGRVSLSGVPANKKLRAQLEKKSTGQLFERLKRLDPRRAAHIDTHNKRRLIRALEIASARISPPGRFNRKGCGVLWIGLSPERDQLRKRINSRLKERLQRGMIAEAKRLRRAGLSYKRMDELGLEYRSLARHLQGKISRQELEAELQPAIWQYAKRQLTYWRRNKDIMWFSPSETKKIGRKVQKWLE